jgi:hypothetical protein
MCDEIIDAHAGTRRRSIRIHSADAQGDRRIDAQRRGHSTRQFFG